MLLRLLLIKSKRRFFLSEKLKSLGVKRHSLSVLTDAGRSIKNGLLSENDKKETADGWLNELNSILGSQDFQVQLKEDHNFYSNNHCGAGSRLIKVDSAGNVHPCLMIDFPWYSLNKGTIYQYTKNNSIIFQLSKNCAMYT